MTDSEQFEVSGLRTSTRSVLVCNAGRECYQKVRSKFQRRCCLRSKAAILILIWNMIVAIGIESFLDPSYYANYFNPVSFTIVAYVCGAFLLLFYPLAGYLADVHWGRYATVVNGLCFVFWSLIMVVILGGVAILGFIPILVYFPEKLDTIQVITTVVLCLVFGSAIVFGILLIFSSLAAFNANVIQFGLDQLHDAPTEDLILFIHWFVWTRFVGLILSRIPMGIREQDIVWEVGPGAILLSIIPFLGVTLCVQAYKRHWFVIDAGSRNPYKLVFKVIKFAAQHKNPVQRSAFTYCEDELPSRLDLGKEKYGGPFKTEEVENVKVFLGILRILLTLGPIFAVEIASKEFITSLARHMDSNYYPTYKKDLVGGDRLTLLLVVFLIPLYLCLRPFLGNYIPGILKRVGIGMILILLSSLYTLLVDIIGHHITGDKGCFFFYELIHTNDSNVTVLFGCTPYQLRRPHTTMLFKCCWLPASLHWYL